MTQIVATNERLRNLIQPRGKRLFFRHRVVVLTSPAGASLSGTARKVELYHRGWSSRLVIAGADRPGSPIRLSLLLGFVFH